jgi:hypothetical protein
MPDYAKGKVYMIESLKGNVRYYGSTCQPLSMRMNGHRADYKKYQNGKHNFITSFQVLEHGDAKIVWIENVPCGSREELEAREAHYVRENECVNRLTPGAVAAAGGIKQYKAAYREANKDRIAEYYQANKERIAEREADYYQANRERIVEYYQANKDRIAEYNQAYRQANRARATEKHTCNCGGKYTTAGKSHHLKTKLHSNWLASQLPEYVEDNSQT